MKPILSTDDVALLLRIVRSHPATRPSQQVECLEAEEIIGRFGHTPSQSWDVMGPDRTSDYGRPVEVTSKDGNTRVGTFKTWGLTSRLMVEVGHPSLVVSATVAIVELEDGSACHAERLRFTDRTPAPKPERVACDWDVDPGEDITTHDVLAQSVGLDAWRLANHRGYITARLSPPPSMPTARPVRDDAGWWWEVANG